MKKLTKLMLTLALLAMGVTGAKAEIKTDWTPSTAYGATWNAQTSTVSWTKDQVGYLLLYTGLTPKGNPNTTAVDLSFYQKLHYNITSLTNAASDSEGAYVELKIGSKNKETQYIKLRQGANDILMSDLAATQDLTQMLEMTFQGTLADGETSGSAVVTEFYLYTDRYEYQTQQQTVKGEALSLSSVVSGNTLVFIGGTNNTILYGKANDGSEWGSNQIKLESYENAMALVSDDDNTCYQFRIIEATDEGLVKPEGITTLYRIKAFKADGTTPFTGPSWNGGSSFFLQEISWTYNVADGTGEDPSFFAITPIEGKTNTYKISAYKKDGTAGYKENIYGRSEWIFSALEEADVLVPVEVQGADTEDPGVPAVADGWISLITNGNLAGDDVSSFWTKDENGNAEAAVINATAGRMNDRGIKVTSKENPAYDWGTQFFIRSSQPLKEGQKLHIEFDYRADKPANAATQVHRNPGDYNANVASIDFTVNWQHFSETYDIPANWCKQDGNTGDSYMLSFGMNLSQDRTSNNFYFDNLVMWADQKEALQNAINLAKMQPRFAKTGNSWDALQKAIEDGEAVLADNEATAESLTNARNDINDAINGLVLLDGYSNLTADMFYTYTSVTEPGEGTKATPAYELFKESSLPYGFNNVSELSWADLKPYSQFIVTTVGETKPRFCLNRTVAEGQQAATMEDSKLVDINPNNSYTWSTEKYQTIEDGNIFKLDISKIVSDYTFARLHCIKGQNSGKVTVTGMYLYQAPATYNVAGTENLTGYNWDESQNEMTYNEETGLYEKTFEKITINSTTKPLFKIVKNGTEWIPASEEGNDHNWEINPAVVGGDGIYNITITFNPANYDIAVIAEGLTYTATLTANTDWDKVYAYVWTGEGDAAVKLAGAWPGKEMEVVDGVYTLSFKANNAPANIIFNNGKQPSEDNAAQTKDLVFEDGKAYKAYTVKFINTSNWTNVYAYPYTNGVADDLGWSGRKMIKIGTDVLNDNTYDLYSYTYVGATAPQNIIFNKGEGGDSNQTPSLVFEDGAKYNYYGASTVTKTISSVGYATYCSANALDFSESGLTAYIAKKDANNKVTFQTVTTVPAKTGVLLKGEAGEHTIKTVASSETNVEGNALIGVTEQTVVNHSGIFVLLNGDKGVGFYKTTAESFTVGANTAYIDAISGARTFIGFDFNDNTTTAIEGVATVKENNGEIYNLQGQRVTKAQKGLYIINGKKVLVK